MIRLLKQTSGCGLLALVSGAVGLQAAEPVTKDGGLPPLPESVASFGAATLDGWLYVYGGHRGERHRYNAEDVSGAFHRLNLAAGRSWERLPASEPQQGAALVTYGQALYRVGGMAARNPRGEAHDLRSSSAGERFEVTRLRWGPLPSLPAPRSSHDAAVVGDTLFVVGGWQLHGGDAKPTWHDQVWTLELAHPGGTWVSVPQPFKRRGLAAAAVGPKLYCLGGMDSEGSTSLAVDVYDTRDKTWSSGAELPAGPMKGFGCAAAVGEGRLYVSGMKGEVHRLAMGGDAWELVGRLEHPRFFHRMVPFGDTGLVVLGGEDSESKRSDLEFVGVASAPAGFETTRLDNASGRSASQNP